MYLYLHAPNTLSWRGAQFKKKAQEQIYLHIFTTIPIVLSLQSPLLTLTVNIQGYHSLSTNCFQKISHRTTYLLKFIRNNTIYIYFRLRNRYEVSNNVKINAFHVFIGNVKHGWHCCLKRKFY